MKYKVEITSVYKTCYLKSCDTSPSRIILPEYDKSYRKVLKLSEVQKFM